MQEKKVTPINNLVFKPSKELSLPQQGKLDDLVHEFAEIWRKKEGGKDWGLISGVSCQIELRDGAVPFKTCIHKQSPLQNKQIHKVEMTHTEAGLTCPSESIWAGQMIGVSKKDGDTCWCNDM
jgi:hypothetical protein